MGWRLRFWNFIQPLEFVAVFEAVVAVARHHQVEFAARVDGVVAIPTAT